MKKSLYWQQGYMEAVQEKLCNREDSDLDVALSYTGDIREDAFF